MNRNHDLWDVRKPRLFHVHNKTLFASGQVTAARKSVQWHFCAHKQYLGRQRLQFKRPWHISARIYNQAAQRLYQNTNKIKAGFFSDRTSQPVRPARHYFYSVTLHFDGLLLTDDGWHRLAFSKMPGWRVCDLVFTVASLLGLFMPY